MLATSDDKRLTRVWNVADGSILFQSGFDCYEASIAFSPDNRFFASTALLGQIIVHELPAGREIVRLEDPKASVLVFSEEARLLATGSQDGTVRVWDLANGVLVWQLEQTMRIDSVVINSHLGLLITACRDGTVYFFNLADGSLRAQSQHATLEDLQKLGSHNAIKLLPVPGKNYLASFSREPSCLRIFDLTTLAELCHFRRQGVDDAAFGPPDGKLVYLSNGSDEVQSCLWHPDDLIASASSLLTSNLTQEEWARYVPGEPYRKTCANLP